MVLPLERPGPSAIRITGDWYAPLGGVLIAACGAFSLIGFPLDDVWHRIFGQDVTLWGPTHLMLIGGAAMTLIGAAVLLREGQRASDRLVAEGGEATAWDLLDDSPADAGAPGRSPARPEHLLRRVRFRGPAVPLRLRPDARDGRRRSRAGLRADVAGARGSDWRRGVLPCHPWPAGPARRADPRSDDASLPALHRRGVADRGRGAVRQHAPPGRLRAGRRGRNRHRRPRGRVGMDAPLEPAALARRRCSRRASPSGSVAPWPAR